MAQIRNISDYQNKSKEDLIKALSEPELKPETIPIPEPETKPETKPKQTPKLQPEPIPERGVNKRKLKKT